MNKIVMLMTLTPLFVSCESGVNFRSYVPNEVRRTDVIEENDSVRIYRESKYKLEAVHYDTVATNRTPSTIESPVRYTPLPKRVDLNDIFDPTGEGETDWNYTELDEEGFLYLDSLGIFYNDEVGYYCKRE